MKPLLLLYEATYWLTNAMYIVFHGIFFGFSNKEDNDISEVPPELLSYLEDKSPEGTKKLTVKGGLLKATDEE